MHQTRNSVPSEQTVSISQRPIDGTLERFTKGPQIPEINKSPTTTTRGKTNLRRVLRRRLGRGQARQTLHLGIRISDWIWHCLMGSKKQPTVSLSSTEAKYKAMSDSCKEALWLRSLLTELKIQPSSSIPLHVDNEGAEALAKNPEHHTRTKHIDTRYHFICECVSSRKVSVQHVSSKDMLADTLTKPLSRVLLEHHRILMGLV